jgi:hypothetical protein
MIDLKKLEAEREAAAVDKADLFDFYHKNYPTLVAEIERLRVELNKDCNCDQCQCFGEGACSIEMSDPEDI